MDLSESTPCGAVGSLLSSSFSWICPCRYPLNIPLAFHWRLAGKSFSSTQSSRWTWKDLLKVLMLLGNVGIRSGFCWQSMLASFPEVSWKYLVGYIIVAFPHGDIEGLGFFSDVDGQSLHFLRILLEDPKG